MPTNDKPAPAQLDAWAQARRLDLMDLVNLIDLARAPLPEDA